MKEKKNEIFVADGSAAKKAEEILSSKKERLNYFLVAKDEMNAIRLMSSIEDGCNHVLDDGTPIFEYAWANDMLTLCSAIADDSRFNPNVDIYSGDKKTLEEAICPISHSVFIDTFDDAVPEWKRKLYFTIADKIFHHKNIDFATIDNHEEVGMNLLMYIVENKNKNLTEYFCDLLSIGINKSEKEGKYLELFSSDVDGYTFISHAILSGNYDFVSKITELLPEYDLTTEDEKVIKKYYSILKKVVDQYK